MIIKLLSPDGKRPSKHGLVLGVVETTGWPRMVISLALDRRSSHFASCRLCRRTCLVGGP